MSKVGELVEFPYEKYGEHVVAMRCEGGGNRQLFDACKLFMDGNTRREYEAIKDKAAAFAKDFVKTYNAGLEKGNQR